MSTRGPYQPGDTVRALVRTGTGTTLASGTVADCSPRGEGSWSLRVRVCGTDHAFTVTRDGSDANGYLERVPGRRDDGTTTTTTATTDDGRTS